MSDLDRELAAFAAMQEELTAKHSGQWVVFHDGKFVAAFPSFDSAATEAVARFGAGPYLIKQVGAPPVVMPASVMFAFRNA